LSKNLSINSCLVVAEQVAQLVVVAVAAAAVVVDLLGHIDVPAVLFAPKSWKIKN
jgi:hypothetical protein